MKKYKEIFNGKSIYDYPFTDSIQKFLIIWWTDINILTELDFDTIFSNELVVNDDITIKFISRDLKETDSITIKIDDFNYNFYEE